MPFEYLTIQSLLCLQHLSLSVFSHVCTLFPGITEPGEHFLLRWEDRFIWVQVGLGLLLDLMV